MASALDNIDSELSKLDPDVPFRATRTHTHHTWAKTFYSHPSLYIRPHTLPEIQKAVTLARRCRRRLVVVGCGHSPSDLTCTSAWMMNLDRFDNVLRVDKASRTMTVEGGIRLRDMNLKAKEHGLTMPNLGSIDQQSIVGALATATHGSAIGHGLLSKSVRSLRIVLANGRAVRCSNEQSQDLFRAALVSLGALGVIVEVEFEMVQATNIEWTQTLRPLSFVLDNWEKDLWTAAEYTRVWWLPYTSRAIVWSAEKTSSPPRQATTSWYGGSMGFHTYHVLLWLANYVPRLLPAIEWFVFGMQYGFKLATSTSAIEEQRSGLLMNCLYSQFVNEWAFPLHKGPEAIMRLQSWINGDAAAANIPVSPKGVWVHAPIEVRVSDTSSTTPRPFLDPSFPDGPTLYLNATLYRPYGLDPPCVTRYYEAFEHLMKELGARPHWAKNFSTVSKAEVKDMYGESLTRWLRVRDSVDPEGMFVGDWHRRYIMPATTGRLPLEEKEVGRVRRSGGGIVWVGEMETRAEKSGWASGSSESSFDQLNEAETEASVLLREIEGSEGEIGFSDDEEVGAQVVEGAIRGVTGVRVFDRM
ncbi:D-arabinono-1,4-lactone oxidase [Aulographum hederae CBS 113979]|uniref:D-arabinono-1,4-lactone oxidase n=1 Tax=Aulographum hederae CBS 113979 TaxID=1176131 RepID=A0A6G1GWM0_9PEZI|nr:D-arabinono-1,4-lactone oxidase [Aulographum hederae CBS 113979]